MEDIPAGAPSETHLGEVVSGKCKQYPFLWESGKGRQCSTKIDPDDFFRFNSKKWEFAKLRH